eukprot:scaffold177_cov334-Pavlova_lutheri.AAC.56
MARLGLLLPLPSVRCNIDILAPFPSRSCPRKNTERAQTSATATGAVVGDPPRWGWMWKGERTQAFPARIDEG